MVESINSYEIEGGVLFMCLSEEYTRTNEAGEKDLIKREVKEQFSVSKLKYVIDKQQPEEIAKHKNKIKATNKELKDIEKQLNEVKTIRGYKKFLDKIEDGLLKYFGQVAFLEDKGMDISYHLKGYNIKDYNKAKVYLGSEEFKKFSKRKSLESSLETKTKELEENNRTYEQQKVYLALLKKALKDVEKENGN